MRIVLNLLAAVSGGQLSRARAFLERFERFAPESRLVVIKNPSLLAQYGATGARTVIDVPLELGRLRALNRMWWECRNLASIIRTIGADAYLTFSHFLPPVNAIPVPSVVGVSNLEPFSTEAIAHESPRARLRLRALRRTIVSSARRATRVIALSETCRSILERVGVAPEKIAVVPNGVDEYWGQPAEPDAALTKLNLGRSFVLYVSHFHRYKNHRRLLEAYARLPRAIREEHQLVLVGAPLDLTYFEEVQALVLRRGLAKDVVLLPGEDHGNLRALYQSALLFVFPSLIENSPNILLEAMMAGAPVAASNLAPMPEFCRDSAEYFDALEETSICEVMGRLLTDPARREQLRARSVAQARLFSWDDFVARVLDNVGVAVQTAGRERGIARVSDVRR